MLDLADAECAGEGDQEVLQEQGTERGFPHRAEQIVNVRPSRCSCRVICLARASRACVRAPINQATGVYHVTYDFTIVNLYPNSASAEYIDDLR